MPMFFFITTVRKIHLTLSYLDVLGTSRFVLLFDIIKLSRKGMEREEGADGSAIKWDTHAHITWECVRASHLVVRMHISFWCSQARFNVGCACTSHFGLRISFWCAHAHFTLGSSLSARSLFWERISHKITSKFFPNLCEHPLLKLLKSLFIIQLIRL